MSSPTPSDSSTFNHSLPSHENTLNTHRIKNPFSQEEENLCPEEQYDIELRIAALVPLCRCPVKRIIIPPRSRGLGLMEIVPAVSELFPVEKEGWGEKEVMGTVEWMEEQEVGERVEEEVPPAPLPGLPPPIPPRPKRSPRPVQTSSERVVETRNLLAAPRDEIPSTAPVPEKSVRVKKPVLPPPPLPLPKHSRPSTPPPIRSIPEPTIIAPESTTIALSHPPKSHRDILLPFPVPGARRHSESGLYVLTSASTAASTSAGSKAEAAAEVDEQAEYEIPEGNWNPPLMRRMYSDCLAGRGVFDPKRLRLEALREALEDDLEKEAEEARQVFRKQRRFFGLVDDGRGFRDPFLEMRISGNDVGDILKISGGGSPKTKTKGGGSERGVRMALGNESLHGLMVSPRIVGRDVVGGMRERRGSEEAVSATKDPTVDENTPGKEWAAYEYMFNGWSSFSPENGNAQDHEGVEEQNEIINPFAGQFAIPGNEWTAPLAWRSESGSSDYSSHSRPSSQVPHMRKGEKLSYSLIQNPWTNAFDSLSARTQFQHAANEFFSGFDIEALVASMQEPGYELAETESGKGSPELFHLGPHQPKQYCGCEFCYRHFHPTLEILKTHDPSEWCDCSSCSDFRVNRDVEKNRAEQNAAWKARLDELAAEVDDARAEEESRLLDLPDFKEDDNQEEFKPKKAHRVRDWVRSHLQCPTPRE
jgi:hypothetical protein